MLWTISDFGSTRPYLLLLDSAGLRSDRVRDGSADIIVLFTTLGEVGCWIGTKYKAEIIHFRFGIQGGCSAGFVYVLDFIPT